MPNELRRFQEGPEEQKETEKSMEENMQQVVLDRSRR
jgi:hypothetical protein